MMMITGGCSDAEPDGGAATIHFADGVTAIVPPPVEAALPM
jgi:hypothetical protein